MSTVTDSLERDLDIQNKVVDKKLEKMQDEMSGVISNLRKEFLVFEPQEAFLDLYNYIEKYDRVLYTTVSSIIYEANLKSKNVDIFSRITTNITTLIEFVEDKEKFEAFSKEKELKTKTAKDVKKTIYKLWDHINLANQQYMVFWQSEEQYQARFEQSIAKYKSDMMKNMSTQLLTMIAIFTALAFIVFGSISSLQSTFSEMNHTPVLKVLLCGTIWGIGVLNVIFVFLFCVGKMTDLDFKSDKRSEAYFIQKYPIVVLTNIILIGLFTFLLLGYYVWNNKIQLSILSCFVRRPDLWLVILLVILVVVFVIFGIFYRKGKNNLEE